VTDEMIDNAITCEMSSTADGVLIQRYANLTLNLPSSEPKINATEPYNMRQYDSVNCSMKGNPPPTVTWISVRNAQGNPSDSNKKPGWAILNLDDVGKDVAWKCSAQGGYLTMEKSKTFSFNVSSSTNQVVGSGNVAAQNLAGWSVVVMTVISLLANRLSEVPYISTQ